MQPVQKILTTMLWGCAVLAMVSVIGAALLRDRAGTGAGEGGNAENGGMIAMEATAAQEADGPVRLTRDAPAFSLIDQNDKPVTLETLKGKPFIANFIFTHCAGPCPVMSAKMASLQKSVPAAVKLLSFSVDPKQDRPAVLKEYGKRFKADDSRWHFLTVANTDDAGAVYSLARGMLVAAQPADDANPIIHSEKFVLVDSDGVIRAYYNSDDATQMEQLKSDAKALLDEPPGKR
jgi:protein SCO1/2